MKKFLILISSVVLLSACTESLLEPFTPGVIQSEEVATQTSGQLQTVLNTGYNILTNREEAVFTSVFTDEAVPGFNNGGQGISGESNYFNFQVLPDSDTDAIWASSYSATAYFNLVLKYVDVIKPASAGDVLLLKRIKGDALVMRAFAHAKVLPYFSGNLTADNALAGIVADSWEGSKAFESKKPRATNAVYYAFVQKDLDDAIAIYSDPNVPTAAAADRAFQPGISLAQALKARMFLYRKDYVNAELFANQVINTSGVTIAPRLALATVFHTHTSPPTMEVIYKLRRTVQQNGQGSNLHNGWVSVANRRTGSPFYEVSRSLFNVLNPTNAPTAVGVNDSRAFLVVRSSAAPPSVDGSLINPLWATDPNVLGGDILVTFKHGGASAATATNGFNPDFIQVRISEMHFIVAEARAYANDFPAVSNRLKFITDRRLVNPTAALIFANRQEALRAILDERRKELCFEGFRFVDLKRLYQDAGLTAFDRHPVDYIGLQFPGGNPANFVFTNNSKWALPIPQTEINANPNAAQNPGY